MRGTVCAVAAFVASLFLSGVGRAATYLIDFGPSSGQPTSGYINAPTSPATVPFNTVTSPTYTLGGGVTLSLSGVNNYSLGNAANPLVTDGFFVNSGTGSSTYTITGLAPGSVVSVYGINAWDGNGSAAFASFNGGALVDLSHTPEFTSASGLPGTSPTLSDFTLIGGNVVAVGTSLSGVIDRTNGVITRGEGQIGGMAIVISVPEPATATALGLAGCFVLIRRRRANRRSGLNV
jgi:hypothetical protein